MRPVQRELLYDSYIITINGYDFSVGPSSDYPSAIREIFVQLLLYNMISDPANIWNDFQDSVSNSQLSECTALYYYSTAMQKLLIINDY